MKRVHDYMLVTCFHVAYQIVSPMHHIISFLTVRYDALGRLPNTFDDWREANRPASANNEAFCRRGRKELIVNTLSAFLKKKNKFSGKKIA